MEKEISKIEKVMEEMSTLNINAGNRQLIAKWADVLLIYKDFNAASTQKISKRTKDLNRY